MSSALAISSSGMQAAQLALDASARNIANLATGDFRRAQVVQATAAQGGVTASWTQAAEPGPAIETDLVGQLVAKGALLANLAVFKASDRMLGTWLDAKT
jgi:flagellar basal body rod protein FlgG